MKKPIFLVLMLLTGCTTLVSGNVPNSEYWNVVSVHDGDTIKAIKNGKTETFRLCGIDAPELKQPLGTQSRDKLKSLINLSSGNVAISSIETDRYNRKITEIFVVKPDKEIFLNEELVRLGLAYHYKQYSKNCPNRHSIELAESLAQKDQVGVWSGNYQKPWDYRKSKRK